MKRSVLVFALFVSVPGLAWAQGEGELEQRSKGYRWTRGKVRFDLVDRGKRWSKKDAERVASAFDRLPDALLRPASDWKVRWYRDPVTTGRGGEKKPDASATTVVEKAWISMSDTLFKKGREDKCYSTVTHELGHVIQYALRSSNPYVARALVASLGTPGFTSISWTLAATDGLKSYNGFVSDYARSGNREDFAESVEFYWLNPRELERANPRKYRFMRDEVFKGVLPPKSQRLTNWKRTALVRPELRSLSKSEGRRASLVKVRGKYFMGPLDGGYNRVSFRGKRALHLPVSRSTIWSWVPAFAKTGSNPVRVRTQDGSSEERAFRVKKPWWKFW